MPSGNNNPEESEHSEAYDSQCDAECLKKHAEIQSNPDRHQAAKAHLEKQQVLHQKAIQTAHKQLHGKVRKGLKKAFGDGAGSKTPFEQAAGEPMGGSND